VLIACSRVVQRPKKLANSRNRNIPDPKPEPITSQLHRGICSLAKVHIIIDVEGDACLTANLSNLGGESSPA
jgi:hypothetical protein